MLSINANKSPQKLIIAGLALRFSYGEIPGGERITLMPWDSTDMQWDRAGVMPLDPMRSDGKGSSPAWLRVGLVADPNSNQLIDQKTGLPFDPRTDNKGRTDWTKTGFPLAPDLQTVAAADDAFSPAEPEAVTERGKQTKAEAKADAKAAAKDAKDTAQQQGRVVFAGELQQRVMDGAASWIHKMAKTDAVVEGYVSEETWAVAIRASEGLEDFRHHIEFLPAELEYAFAGKNREEAYGRDEAEAVKERQKKSDAEAKAQAARQKNEPPPQRVVIEHAEATRREATEPEQLEPSKAGLIAERAKN